MNSTFSPRRCFLRRVVIGSAISCAPSAWFERLLLAGQNILSQATDARLSRAPKCSRIPGTCFRFEGSVRDYLVNVSEQWLKLAPVSNPAILEMFRDRDRQPLRGFG